MTVDDFCKKVGLKKKEAYAMMKYAGIPKDKSGHYVVPDDMEPVYIHDNRVYKDEHIRDYLYIMDAIGKNQKLILEKIGMSRDRMRTYVRELKKAGLIKLIDGKDERSLDYQDYVLALSSDEWLKKRENSKATIIVKAIGEIGKILVMACNP